MQRTPGAKAHGAAARASLPPTLRGRRFFYMRDAATSVPLSGGSG